ncbi:polysaccharide deacetylase family protein [Tamlana crocina]
MFPNYVWDIPTNEKVIYLTFDDGPTPEITNWTLATLKQYQAKATFFCIGNNIEKHPDIFQNIIKEGHAVGNHTHNHIKGWKTKTWDYLENIKQCEKVFKAQAPQSSIVNRQSLTTNLFRPPYGQITLKQGKNLIESGYKIIMWDVLSFDWDKNISPETCLKNVTTKAVEGSIIVFHDSVKASKNMQYTLPKVLDYFSGKGFVFKSLGI